jgi:hypothetical protein
MREEVSSYLEEVKTHLRLDPRTKRRVISELHTHFQEKVEDLVAEGLHEKEATNQALASFGDARSIARLTYEAYSRGSWTDAFLACQPHLIVAALFATHIWRNPVLLGAAFAAIVVIALLGWKNASPHWLYTWVGYAVLPLLIVSYMSVDPVSQTVNFLLHRVGRPAPLWHLAALAVLYVFTIWLISSTTVTVARSDWLLVSIMLLPLPVLGIWIASVSQSGSFSLDAVRGLETRFSRWDSPMASLFLFLGVTTALFVRLRQRTLKVAAVIAVGIVGGAATARSIWGDLGIIRLIAVSLCLLFFLTIPLLLHTLPSIFRVLPGVDDEPKEPLPS